MAYEANLLISEYVVRVEPKTLLMITYSKSSATLGHVLQDDNFLVE